MLSYRDKVYHQRERFAAHNFPKSFALKVNRSFTLPV